MAQFKEIWYYTSANSGKWSEVFYSEAPSLKEAADFAGVGVITARLRLLHSLNVLRKIRVSQVNSPRVSTIVNVNRSGLDDDANPASIDLAMVCNLSSSDKPSSRRWWCRGIADDTVRRSNVTGADVLGPNSRKDLASFLKSLQRENYVILPLTRVGLGDVVLTNVKTVNGTANDGLSIITTDKAHGLETGDICIFQRLSKKDLPGMNGKFKVVAKTDPTNFTIEYRTPLHTTITPTAGKVKKQLYQSGAKINAEISGFSFLGSRQAKNDNTGSRGARSAQKVRSLD